MISSAVEQHLKVVDDFLNDRIINYKTGFTLFDRYMPITPNRQLVYAGEPKSGKTRKVMRMLFNLIKRYTNIEINLFSFEILGRDIVLWELCNMLNCSEQFILAGKFDTEFKVKYEQAINLMKKLSINVYDKRMSANEMQAIMERSCEKYKGKRVHCREAIGGESVDKKRYPLIINVLDHSRKVIMSGDEIKGITALSQMFTGIRDTYPDNAFNIIISQYTRTITSSERKQAYKPQLSDLFGGSAMEQDANYVVGVANPFRNETPDYFGYDITKMKQYFRAEHVLANRHGASDEMIGLLCDFGKQRFREIGLDKYSKKAFNDAEFTKFINTLTQ
jgi:replicative DNA helicase